MWGYVAIVAAIGFVAAMIWVFAPYAWTRRID